MRVTALRVVVASAAACASLAAAPSARADKFDETVDVALRLTGSWVVARELALAPVTTDDPLPALAAERPRLDGDGRSFGGLLRFGLGLDGLRFGAGAGALRLAGLELVTDAGDGRAHGLELGELWGLSFEVYAGYAFGSARDVRPYLEARGTVDVLFTRLTAEGSGRASLYAAAPGVALAAGLLLPVSQYFFADVGVAVAPYGPERLSLFGALGVPIPLANL
ncbi:MAG: hypothetical protein IT373_35235 [Polyangiaceae bacterium]|nr:hypothetical protein [Polyangiaceae bacterium]